MDRKYICICAVIVGLCVLCAGCRQEDGGSVFEMDQGGSDTVSGQEDAVQVDQETLRVMLEEVLASVEMDPVIEVTCSCSGEARVQQIAMGSDAGTPADDGKLNINTADMSALQDLNGIGETRAQAIISYRESYGAFQSIEDIKQVDGIKDGIFNKIKDEISVG